MPNGIKQKQKKKKKKKKRERERESGNEEKKKLGKKWGKKKDFRVCYSPHVIVFFFFFFALSSIFLFFFFFFYDVGEWSTSTVYFVTLTVFSTILKTLFLHLQQTGNQTIEPSKNCSLLDSQIELTEEGNNLILLTTSPTVSN